MCRVCPENTKHQPSDSDWDSRLFLWPVLTESCDIWCWSLVCDGHILSADKTRISLFYTHNMTHQPAFNDSIQEYWIKYLCIAFKAYLCYWLYQWRRIHIEFIWICLFYTIINTEVYELVSDTIDNVVTSDLVKHEHNLLTLKQINSSNNESLSQS